MGAISHRWTMLLSTLSRRFHQANEASNCEGAQRNMNNQNIMSKTLKTTKHDWSRLDAMTAAERHAAARRKTPLAGTFSAYETHPTGAYHSPRAWLVAARIRHAVSHPPPSNAQG